MAGSVINSLPSDEEPPAPILDFSLVVEIECLKRKEYLTPEEVNKLYGLKTKTLANKRSLGNGPKYVKDGRIILYPHKELRNFLDSRSITPHIES